MEFSVKDFVLITELAKDNPVPFKKADLGQDTVYSFSTKETGKVTVMVKLMSYELNTFILEVITKLGFGNAEDSLFSTLSAVVKNFLSDKRPNQARLVLFGKNNVTNAQVGLMKSKIASLGYIPKANVVPGGFSIGMEKGTN